MSKPSATALKARVLALLKSGEASPAELARLAGVSRQLVHVWCEAERIDWRAAYEWRLQMAWENAGQMRRPKWISRAALRVLADRAMKDWESQTQ